MVIGYARVPTDDLQLERFHVAGIVPDRHSGDRARMPLAFLPEFPHRLHPARLSRSRASVPAAAMRH